MNKVKKSLVFLLIGTLLFSFITVLSSADVTIPQGPIDHENRDNGIDQIMKAGVEDKSFATAIYDAFTAASYFGDESKNVREILGEYDGRINAINRGIKSIAGIEWLRSTKAIDLNNDIFLPNPEIKNEITDLEPLSVKNIMKVGNISEEEALQWFKPTDNSDGKRNLLIDLTGNPINKYEQLAGWIDLTLSGDYPNIATDSLHAIKIEGNPGWSLTKGIDLPVITKDGKQVKFADKDGGVAITYIDDSTTNADISINYNQLNNNILEINNIKHSGDVHAITGIKLSDGINFYKYGRNPSTGIEGSNKDGISYAYETNFRTRIYTPVYPEKEIKKVIKVTKSATCDYSGKKVVGAKYYLYDANTNNKVSDRVYITDENGEFYVDENLPVGEYYLLEFEAPEGFLLNESEISFSVVADQCNISISGGDKNLNINAGNEKEDPNTVYIDRYSNNVTVSINDDPNYFLEKVDLVYFDRETQADKMISFAGKTPGIAEGPSASEVANSVTEWINANKGNAEGPGIIDGKVTVKAYFNYNRELQTSDPRPVMNVGFTKEGGELNENGEIVEIPLANATFKLECTHKHTDHCKDADGNYSIKRCTDPHTDCGEYFTPEGCSWSTEVTSGLDGKVLYSGINTGIYKMTETVVPDGHLPPDTTWTVVVNALKNEFTITANNKKSIDSNIDGNQTTGYKILNFTFNVKVKKIDSDTKEPLEGATFRLFKNIKDESGEDYWVPYPKEPDPDNPDDPNDSDDITGKDGYAYFRKLTEGEYMIQEIEAPPGYELITEVVKFNVPFEYTSIDKNGIEHEFVDDTKTVTFTISDKVGVVLPNTGATLTARIATLGIVMMGIMVILFKKTKNIESNKIN